MYARALGLQFIYHYFLDNTVYIDSTAYMSQSYD